MEPINRPETLVMNYHYRLRDNLEERRHVIYIHIVFIFHFLTFLVLVTYKIE